jgi:Mrp family chromosome partitioning ATPase
VIDPRDGRIIAGARLPGTPPDAPRFADTVEALRARGGEPLGFGAGSTNTVLVVVATNARLGKEGANILAQMADVVLLVVEAGRTPARLVQRTAEALGKERVMGVILNRADDVSSDSSSAYAYGPTN